MRYEFRFIRFLSIWLFLQFGIGVSFAQSIEQMKDEIKNSWQTDPQAAIDQSAEVFEKASANSDHANEAWALNMQGVIYGAMGSFDESFEFYAQSLELCRAHGITDVEQKTLMNLAINYQYQGRYEDAMKSYLNAIQSFEASGDSLGMAHALSGLGGVHWYLDQPQTAMQDYRKAILIYENLGRYAQTAPIHSNLGVFYRDIGDVDSALICFNKAEKLLTNSENEIGLISLYINKAEIYEENAPDSALYFYDAAYKRSNDIQYERGIVIASTSLGSFYLRKGQYAKADFHADYGRKMAYKLGDLEFQKQGLKIMHQAQSKMGNKQLAYTSLKRYLAISDSILNLESQKVVAELEIKYQTAKKEKEIAESRVEIASNQLKITEDQARITQQELDLVRGKRWITALIVAAIALGLIGLIVFFYQQDRRKKAIEQLSLQKNLEESRREKAITDEKLRISRELHDNIGSQITFMISSLDNLHHVNQDASTGDRLGQLSGFARGAIADLRHTIWALNQDISLADLQARLSDLVQNVSGMTDTKIVLKPDLSANPALSSDQAINLMRIAQEALQNAIKHADAQSLQLKIALREGALHLSIRDDGAGFDPGRVQDGAGFGLGNMAQRAQAMAAQLQVQSTPGEGTEVIVTLPM